MCTAKADYGGAMPERMWLRLHGALWVCLVCQCGRTEMMSLFACTHFTLYFTFQKKIDILLLSVPLEGATQVVITSPH